MICLCALNMDQNFFQLIQSELNELIVKIWSAKILQLDVFLKGFTQFFLSEPIPFQNP